MKSILILSFILISVSSTKKQIDNYEEFPVFVKYYNGNKPPDSISSFINTYLTLKKIKTGTLADIKKVIEERFQYGRATNYTNLDAPGNNFEEELYKPFARLFMLQLFPDKNNSYSYTIDSIRWQLKLFPDKDTTFRHSCFIPDKKVDTTGYMVLKKFLDITFPAGKKNK